MKCFLNWQEGQNEKQINHLIKAPMIVLIWRCTIFLEGKEIPLKD
jgi:hypothetical protein